MMKTILVTALSLLLSGIIPSGKAFLNPLQQRDSALVADQFEYGIRLDSLQSGVQLAFPQMAEVFDDTLVLVRDWQIDTLRGRRKAEFTSVKASIIISPFEEGTFELPALAVQKTQGDDVDTLVFDAPELEVYTIPVDTATFVIHDIKDQIRYPLTPGEVVPYVVAFQLLAMLVIAIVCLVKLRRRSGQQDQERSDPPYIVALRRLDKYRGDRYWAPEKQKTMYSGITDALRTYIEARFGVNAEEMTTAEIFDALKGNSDIPEDLYGEMKELFELSDYVKFAKHTASDEDNARAIPSAVRFVTSTYQTQLESEQEVKDVL